jgi:hypothetical protein
VEQYLDGHRIKLRIRHAGRADIDQIAGLSFFLALSGSSCKFQFSKLAAILSDVGLEGSVYFVCQRPEAGISRMKFVGPVIFGLQRSCQIDMQNVGRRCQSLEHRVQRIHEFHDYVVAHLQSGVVIWIVLVIKRIIEYRSAIRTAQTSQKSLPSEEKRIRKSTQWPRAGISALPAYAETVLPKSPLRPAPPRY